MAKKKAAPNDQRRPVRDLIYSSPHRMVGEVHVTDDLDKPSPQYESSGEHSCLLLMGCCMDVKGIASQPFRESFVDLAGRGRTHTPDFQVIADGKPVIVEYKPLRVAVKEEVMEKLMALGKHYLAKGQRFSILTSDQIDLEPRRANASTLRRFRFSPVFPEREQFLITQLKDGPKAICELAPDDGVPDAYRDVCALISRGALAFDWAVPLVYGAKVSLPDNPYKRLTYADIENSGRFSSLLQELSLGHRPTDSGLLAAARARDWSVSTPSAFGFVGGLPAGAFAGRFRTPGSLTGKAGYCDDSDADGSDCGTAATGTRSMRRQ